MPLPHGLRAGAQSHFPVRLEPQVDGFVQNAAIDFEEAADPAGELYGEDRIATFMQQADPGDPGLLSTLVRQVRDFEGGMPPSDDMAAILLSLREDATG